MKHDELNTIQCKLESFSTKYNCTFEQFEQRVEISQKENFEEWDDYIEWNAFQKSYQEYLLNNSTN